MKTIEITETNFATEVLQSPVPVLLDFWGDGCGPCKMIAPVLDQIAADHQGRAKVGKVNVYDNPGLTQKYQVSSLPTLLFFARGEVVGQTIGAASRKKIESELEKLTVTKL